MGRISGQKNDVKDVVSAKSRTKTATDVACVKTVPTKHRFKSDSLYSKTKDEVVSCKIIVMIS